MIDFLIRIYQHTLSPDHGILRFVLPATFRCRFTPTCSEYAREAFSERGIRSGAFPVLTRLFRCHPWNEGGYDPFPSEERRRKV